MCTRVRQAGRLISAGNFATYQTFDKQDRWGKFGLFNGQVPNARDDRYENYWKNQGVLRGLFIIDAFYEIRAYFGVQGHTMAVAAIYKESSDPWRQANEFALITTEAVGSVAEVHHRMPAIVLDQDEWLQGGKLITLNNYPKLITRVSFQAA